MEVHEKKASLTMNMDWPLTGACLLLAFIGLLNLASAGFGAPIVFWHRQFFSLVVAIAAMAMISAIDYRFFNRSAYIVYIIVMALLLATVIWGTLRGGSKAWIRMGPFSMQPSEFMKFATIVAMAKYFHEQRVGGPYGLRTLGMPILLVAGPVGLIMLQPDLGTTVMLTLVVGSMALFAGVRKHLIIGAIIIGLISAPLAWKYFLRPHQKERIQTFLNPHSDPMGAGYNVIQSMVAVGSGRILGKGYKLGDQTALKYLPERHSDFVFSVMGEEWGFAGCVFVMAIFLFVLLWGLRISSMAKDRFGCLAAFGVCALIFWHTVINVAMTLGAFPVVGIPLPFLSYGGSFLITIFAGVGLLMSIEGRRFVF